MEGSLGPLPKLWISWPWGHAFPPGEGVKFTIVYIGKTHFWALFVKLPQEMMQTWLELSIWNGFGVPCTYCHWLTPRGLRGGAKKGEIGKNFKNLLLYSQICWNQILFIDGRVFRSFAKIVNFMTLGSCVSPWGGGKVYYSLYRENPFLSIIC